MSNETAVRVDFDLDLDMAEVADLINFINPIPGKHVYTMAFIGLDRIGKDEDAAMGVRVIWQKVATIEKADESMPDTPNGSVFSETFTGNKMGTELLKVRLKMVYGDIEGSYRPYIEALAEGAGTNQFALTTIITKSTNNGTVYENVRIKDLEVLSQPVDLPEGFNKFEYEPKD
jgi:hypothetical protein